MKKYLGIVALAALALAFTACDENLGKPDPVILAESISLDKTSITLEIGESEILTPTVLPDNASNKTVTWKSSDDKIATVSSSGEVTAVAKGTVTITATSMSGKKTATCTVTVNAPEPEVTISVSTGLSLTAANEIAYSTVLAEEPAEAAITVAATDNLATLTLSLETENAVLTGILTDMGLTEPFELSDPSEAQAAALALIDFPNGEDAIVDKASVKIPLNKLLATIAEAIPDGVAFSIVIDATDANDLEADTATLAISLVDDTPYVTIDGIGDEPVAITADDATVPAIEVAAITSIETLVVEITSENEAFTAALAAFNDGVIDLANPGELADALTGLGLPNGDAVKGQSELSIDISAFVPMMFAFIADNPEGTLDADFKITVTDPEEHSAEKTLSLNLAHPAENGGGDEGGQEEE